MPAWGMAWGFPRARLRTVSIRWSGWTGIVESAGLQRPPDPQASCLSKEMALLRTGPASRCCPLRVACPRLSAADDQQIGNSSVVVVPPASAPGALERPCGASAPPGKAAAPPLRDL